MSARVAQSSGFAARDAVVRMACACRIGSLSVRQSKNLSKTCLNSFFYYTSYRNQTRHRNLPLSYGRPIALEPSRRREKR